MAKKDKKTEAPPEAPPTTERRVEKEKVAKVSTSDGFTRVDLKQDVRINGVLYQAGKQVLVPADAHDVWKHAL